MSDKQLILNTVQNIDDITSYLDILYTVQVQLEIQKGIKDMESGNTKTSNEVKEIIDNTYQIRCWQSIKKIKKRYELKSYDCRSNFKQ